MASIFQILRFTLPWSSATRLATFQALRDRVSNNSVNTQYFGYILPNEGFPERTAENDMCWVISKLSLLDNECTAFQPHQKSSVLTQTPTVTEWPQSSIFQKSPEFKTTLPTIAAGDICSLFFDFQKPKEGEIEKGLEAPVCQFVRSISLTYHEESFLPRLTFQPGNNKPHFHRPKIRRRLWTFNAKNIHRLLPWFRLHRRRLGLLPN